MAEPEWVVRWRGSAGAALAEQVTQRLRDGAALDDLPLGRVDGRIDLRGFSTELPKIAGQVEVREDLGDGGPQPVDGIVLVEDHLELDGVTLRGLDLRHARLSSLRLVDVSIENCRLDEAVCWDWRAWGLTVMDTTFCNADLRDSALGIWSDGKFSSFQSVDFSGADLRSLRFTRSAFARCAFDGSRLDGGEFTDCAFSECAFAGAFSDMIFRGGQLDRVSFAGAQMRYVGFYGVGLAGVELPADREAHVVVRRYPCVVRRALERLAGEPPGSSSSTLRARLQADLAKLDDSRDIGLWHRDELGRTGAEQEAARALLESVERECLVGA